MSIKNTLSLSVLGAVSIVLVGCTSAPEYPTHDFSSELKAPRPFSPEESYAAKKFRKAFGGFTDYVVNSVADTAIWEDEEGIVRGGFDFNDTYEGVYVPYRKSAYSQDAKKKLMEGIVKKYGTVPYAIRDLIPAGSQADTLKLIGDSWYYSGFGSSEFTLGGIGLAFATSVFTVTEEDKKRWRAEREIKILSKYPQISYELTPDEVKEAEKEGFVDVIQGTQQRAEFGRFFGKKILNALAEAAKAEGYEVKGDLITWQGKTKDSQAFFYVLGGNGCPKATSEPWKNNCHVRVPAAIYEGKPLHVMVNNDSDSANMVFAPESYLFFDPNLSKEKMAQIHERLYQTLITKYPNITMFFPARERNGMWEPQKLVDSNGTHYFTVTVKRKR